MVAIKYHDEYWKISWDKIPKEFMHCALEISLAQTCNSLKNIFSVKLPVITMNLYSNQVPTLNYIKSKKSCKIQYDYMRYDKIQIWQCRVQNKLHVFSHSKFNLRFPGLKQRMLKICWVVQLVQLLYHLGVKYHCRPVINDRGKQYEYYISDKIELHYAN